MPPPRCPNCGQTLGSGAFCPGCGARVDRKLVQRIAAAEQLRDRIAKDAKLDEGLAVDLLEQILGYLEDERDRAAAEAASPPERVVPPPAEVVTPIDEPPPVPTAERARRVVESTQQVIEPVTATPREPRPPSIWSRLGPAFAENLLFALAAFLIVGGAVYFGTTAWTTMTGSTRLLVVVGGLLLLAVLLRGAGRLLNRRDTLPEVERVLAVIAAFVAPLATTVTGELTSSSPGVGLAVGLTALVASVWLARSAAITLDAQLVRPLPIGVGAVGALALLAPGASAPLLTAISAGALVIGFGLTVARRIPALAGRWWVALSIVAFAAWADVAAVALRAGVAPLGAVVAMTGAAIAATELGRGRRVELPRSSGSIAMLLAAGLALTGLALAAGTPTAMLVAATAATFATCASAVRFDRAHLLWPGLALSVVAYFLLPAPVREIATEVRAWFAGELGYEPKRLPLSFYGVTFLPYLAAGGFLAEWLQRRGRVAYARITLSWTLAVAIALAGLAVFAGTDARAPMAVLPAEGALLLALGAVTRRQRLVFAGALGLLGGVVAGLLHFELTDPVVLEILTSSGFALILVAALLQRNASEDGFRRRAAHALVDASGTLALGVTAWFATVWFGGDAIDPRFAPGLAAVALWFAALARAYRVSLIDSVAWGAIVLAIRVALGAGALDRPYTALWFALASAVPLILARVSSFPRLAQRPQRIASVDGPSPAEVSPLLFQAMALTATVHRLGSGSSDWPLACAAAVAAVVTGAAAATTGRSWLGVLASIELIAASLLGAGALALGWDGFGVTAALGVGALTLAAIANAARGRTPLRHLAPAADVATLSCAGALVWAAFVVFRVATAKDSINAVTALVPPWPDPAVMLAGMIAVLLAALGVARAGVRDSHAGLSRVLTACAAPLIVLALGDVFGASGGQLAFGLGAAAVVAALTIRTRWPEHAAIHACLAAVVAVAFLEPPHSGDVWLTTALLLTAGAAHPGIGRPAALGTSVALVAWSAFAWAGWTWIRPATDAWWLPVVLVGGATVAEFARRFPPLRLNGIGITAFVAPIAALASIAGSLHVAACLVDGRAPVLTGAPHAASSALAVTAVALAVALALHRSPAPRTRGIGAIALALSAVFLAPVVERTILGDEWRTVLPAIGVASIAIAAAWVRARSTALVFGVAALLVTQLDFDPVTTPIAFAVAAFVPLVTGLRARRAPDVALFADGILLAAVAAVFHLRHPARIDVLPWIAMVAVSLAAVLEGAARRLESRAGFATVCGTAIGKSATRAADVGIALLAIAVIAGFSPASRADVQWSIWPALVASAIATGLALREARRSPTAVIAHRSVAILLVTYGYLATNTGLLDFLGEQKANVLSLAAVGLILARRAVPPTMGRALAIDAVLLPIPAVLAIGTTPSIAGSVALALASAPYAIATRACGWRWCAWITALLINGAVWSLWLHRGIVDAAFYGVPLGLTLAVGSEFTRERTARAILRALGLAIAYGSIAVQVLRVEEPTHALVLFALALGAVAIGWLRRRNDLLLAGTIAVVIDVIAYLVRHGLARDFVGAGLLVAAGVTVLFAAIARRSRSQQG